MEGFPTHFTDDRLLREVINPEFVLLAAEGLAIFHADKHCPSLRQISTTPTSIDLGAIEPANLCQHCTGSRTVLLQHWHNWNQSAPLRGPAQYCIAPGPFIPDDDQPQDPAYRLVHRVITHYQVMTLPRKTDLTWVVSVVPCQLALYLDQVFAYLGAAKQLSPAGPVRRRDTPAMIECALGLWEPSFGGPLATFTNAIAVARTICHP